MSEMKKRGSPTLRTCSAEHPRSEKTPGFISDWDVPLETEVSSLETGVSTLETEASTLETEMSTLETEMFTLETGMSTLETGVST